MLIWLTQRKFSDAYQYVWNQTVWTDSVAYNTNYAYPLNLRTPVYSKIQRYTLVWGNDASQRLYWPTDSPLHCEIKAEECPKSRTGMHLQGWCGVSMEVDGGRMPFLRVATIQSVGPQSLDYGTCAKYLSPSCTSDCSSHNKKATSKCRKRYKNITKKGPCQDAWKLQFLII